jgi:hypothetical protein
MDSNKPDDALAVAAFPPPNDSSTLVLVALAIPTITFDVWIN